MFYAAYLGNTGFLLYKSIKYFQSNSKVALIKEMTTGMCVIVSVLTCHNLSEQNIKTANLNINNIAFKFIL